MTDSPRLRPYAQNPIRAAFQVLADLSVLAWVYAWIWVGQGVHAAIAAVSGAGTSLGSGAAALSQGLRDAGGMAAKVPFIGDRLAQPLNGAAGAAAGVAQAGSDVAAQIQTFAVWTGVFVAAWPIVLGLVLWAVPRYRFARRAAVTADLLAAPGGASLLALRALAKRPIGALTAVHPDPVGAWRAGDPEAIRLLARLETVRSGVRPQPALPAASTYPALSY